MSNLPPREIFEVPFEELHHFGSPPTHEDMVREFALIGSAEAWAKRCGEQLQHGEEQLCFTLFGLALDGRFRGGCFLRFYGFKILL